MSEDVSKAYTYMTSENKKNYDEGWGRPKENTNNR